MPNLKWTLSRLRQMGVTEVGHRVVDAARTVWEAVAASQRWPECPDECLRLLGVERPEQALAAFREKLESLGGLAPAAAERDFAGVRDLPQAQNLIRQAQDILSHRISLFGRTYEFGDEIDWHVDPVHGRSIPRKFYSQVDFRDPGLVGEVKLTWELNRHQHLPRLAQAYLLTRDACYAEEIFTEIESWARMNPPLQGVNWTRSLELGLRLLSWTWSLAAVAGSEVIPAERWVQTLVYARVQLDFLKSHLSYGSSANNHLLGELLGTAWAAAFLPSGGELEQTARKALGRLFREIEEQVYPDGVSRELSLWYHAYVLLYGLLGVALARQLRLPVPEGALQKLRAMGRFLTAVHVGDSVFPALGDDDGGHALPLAPEPYLPRDALDLWAALLGEPLPEDLRQPLGLSWWLLGPGAYSVDDPNSGSNGESRTRESEAVLSDGQVSTLIVFPDAGYAVHRVGSSASPPSLVLFDAGPLGDSRLAAHGHADALSVYWAVDGEEILVDPGTFAYDGDVAWRNAFRSTGWHNTVVVDGRWQSEPGGTFFWLRRADARLLQAEEREGAVWLTGEHGGYARLGVRHRRGVLSLAARTLLVVDWLEGDGRHTVEQRFHFPDGFLKWTPGQRYVEIQLVEHSVLVVPLGWSFRPVVHRMAGPQEGGWLSRRFGEREPALTLALRYEGKLPVRLATLLVAQKLDLAA